MTISGKIIYQPSSGQSAGSATASKYRPAMRDTATFNTYPMNIIPASSSLLSNGFITNRPTFTMIPLDEGMHISRVGLNITTSTGGSILQVAIYDVGADGFPNNVVFQTALPVPTTTGDKEAVVDWTIPAGNFFYMAVTSTSGVFASAFDSPEIRTAGLQGSSSSTFLNSDFRPTLALVGGEFPSPIDISANPSGNRSNTFNVYFKDIA